MLGVLLCRMLSVERVHRVQLYCTDSNYRESDCYVDCIIVQNVECAESVECASELY